MNLSYESLVVCSNKYGQGQLVGFEDENGETLDALAQRGVKNIFDELSDGEMIFYDGEEVHISALGHHILNMMIRPEVFIQIDNALINRCLKIYIKNSYYLCVLKNNANAADGATVELLPTLREVVGSFAYTLYSEDLSELLKENGESNGLEEHISVFLKAFDADGNPESERRLDGKYTDSGITYKEIDAAGDDACENSIKDCDIDEFINNITLWMFDRLSKVMESEVG